MSHSKASPLRGTAPLGYFSHSQTKTQRDALAHQYAVRSQEDLAAEVKAAKAKAAAAAVAARVVARAASRRSRRSGSISKPVAMGLLKRHRKKSRKNRGQRKRAQTRKR